jgi:NTP pyrophosphatase (non-canonical NTP hydrolase)
MTDHYASGPIPNQYDVAAWLAERFGPDRDLADIFRKLGSEVGELGWAVDCVTAARLAPELPGPVEGWAQNLRDETADVVLVCMAIAVAEDFDLREAVAEKWARRKRGPASE